MTENYSSTEYWNKRYTNTKGHTYEWLEDFLTLKPLFTELVSLDSKILMIGCGNSRLSEDLYNNGYENITNIDISNIVVEDMQKRCIALEGMKWIQADCTDMTKLFEDSEFDVVIDKSTLDTILCGENGYFNASMTVNEVRRV